MELLRIPGHGGIAWIDCFRQFWILLECLCRVFIRKGRGHDQEVPLRGTARNRSFGEWLHEPMEGS